MPSSSRELARRAPARRLAGLELAAGKFPVAGIRRAGQAAAPAARAVAPHAAPRPRRARPTRRSRVACAALSARAPAWARANCQATRPLRDPRCKRELHRLAVQRLARRARRAAPARRENASQPVDGGEIVVLAERIERNPQAEALGQRDLLLDRFAGMHLLADVLRLEVLAEVLGQQVAAVRRRVDQRRSTTARRSCRRASP